ncbi:lipase [Mycolicibacterium mucogenicum]|uniref:Lipase n=1 Tax=Mycolicibacterium mucogenicum TaxID=56689 RepID=A0A1A0MXJ0_MYCMU|nr:lipase family protein [Mycolicibacterium mucogenicum]OBA90107.1 lipase [Mycolicibacterium mucogenicum]
MTMGNAARAFDAEWIGQPYHEELRPGIRPLRPSEDTFYVPPVGFELTVPGTVLRSRDVELGFMGLIPQGVTATQLLYRSTDLGGSAQAAVTTVLLPVGHNPDTRCPIVSYQCAIDAVSDACFPSYALRRRARALGSVAQLEYMLVAAVLAQGWAVSIPDHEGTDGIWGAPHEPGYHILDGLRAAINTESLGLYADAPIGLWGYSGGGLASAWAAEEYANYAPELNVVGAALGSPVGDLAEVFRRLNGTSKAGLPATVIAALMHIYPGLKRIIHEHATEAGKAMLRNIEGMTTAEAVIRHAGLDFDTLLKSPLQEVLDTPEVQHVFESIKLGKTAPTPPLLIMQAVYDQIIAVGNIDELTDTYVMGGSHVTYHRDILSEHIALHPLAAPMTLNWLAERFDGKPLGPTVRTSWPALLNPATYLGLLKLGVVSTKVLLGLPIGRR